jgi:hypothetical protein
VGLDISGVGPFHFAASGSKIYLREIGCEDGKWPELVQNCT